MLGKRNHSFWRNRQYLWFNNISTTFGFKLLPAHPLSLVLPFPTNSFEQVHEKLSLLLLQVVITKQSWAGVFAWHLLMSEKSMQVWKNNTRWNSITFNCHDSFAHLYTLGPLILSNHTNTKNIHSSITLFEVKCENPNYYTVKEEVV